MENQNKNQPFDNGWDEVNIIRHPVHDAIVKELDKEIFEFLDKLEKKAQEE